MGHYCFPPGRNPILTAKAKTHNTLIKCHVVKILQVNFKFWQIAITLLHILTYSDHTTRRIGRLTFSSSALIIAVLRTNLELAMQLVGKTTFHIEVEGSSEAVTLAWQWRCPLFHAWKVLPATAKGFIHDTYY